MLEFLKTPQVISVCCKVWESLLPCHWFLSHKIISRFSRRMGFQLRGFANISESSVSLDGLRAKTRWQCLHPAPTTRHHILISHQQEDLTVTLTALKGFPSGSNGKELLAMQETWVRSLGQDRGSLETGDGYPLQHSCLENSMDRGSWLATVHGITKSWTWLIEFLWRLWCQRIPEQADLNKDLSPLFQT